MHDDHANRPLSYGNELALARELADRGDHKHALHHCSGAIALDPHRSDWQPVLRELVARPGMVECLQDDTFFGAKAALAWHLHDTRQVTDAIDLIGAVAAAVPHLGFQQWFGTWLEEAAAAHIAVDAGMVLRVLLLGTSFGIGRIRLLPSERAAATELAPIARFAAETVADPQVFLLASAVLRRAGNNTEAIAMAERARAGGEAAQVATVIGLALRANGDYQRAIAVFDGAHKATGDVIYLQEKFRALADAGRWQEAHHLAQQITRSKPADGESELEYAFVAHALRTNAPAPTVPPLDDIRRRSLGHGILFPMTDATANAMRQLAQARFADGVAPAERADSVQVAVAGSESPSNRLLVALLGGEADLRAVSYSMSDPDGLRQISDEVTPYTLWRADGQVIVQALPEPPAAVLEWVEQLAAHDHERTDFLDMWAHAATTALPAATARDWVAATVHPRLPIAYAKVGPDWLYRWQVAALIGLACMPGDWAGSPKRDALLAVLRGAIDWPLAAAIRVAAELALHDPSAIHELRQALLDLLEPVEHVPNPALPTTLLVSLEMLPYVGRTYLDRLRESLAARDARSDADADDHEEVPAEEPAAQPKRPWWKFWGN